MISLIAIISLNLAISPLCQFSLGKDSGPQSSEFCNTFSGTWYALTLFIIVAWALPCQLMDMLSLDILVEVSMDC